MTFCYFFWEPIASDKGAKLKVKDDDSSEYIEEALQETRSLPVKILLKKKDKNSSRKFNRTFL